MRKLGILALLIGATLLSSCSSVSLGSPKSAAESFYKAVENRNEEDFKDTICEELRDDAQLPEGPDDSEFEIDFDVRFYEKSKDGDNAEVSVYGHVKVRIITDEADYEQKKSSRDDNELDVIELRKEDGDWKVCDRAAVNFTDLFS